MPKLPTVAIVGRPNTGKSTLFNRLIGSRRAIVSEIPGTTRDPVVQRVEGEEVDYLLMDTGGMGGGTRDRDFEDDVAAQSLLALEHADLILFLVNGREELTSSDFEVVDALRKKRKRHVSVFLVITKCDDLQKMEEALPKFLELGISDDVFAVSAFHGLGMDELEDGIEEKLVDAHFSDGSSLRASTEAALLDSSPPLRSGDSLEENGFGASREAVPKVAIVGRPNVGKSSLINALMPEPQRKTQSRLTSDVPGTTRDTTDTVLRSHGKEFLFLDTAGLKRRKNVKEDVEVYAIIRTLQAIEDADVTVLVLDATQEIGRQDKRIAALAIARGSGLILLANKTDLLSEEEKQEFQKQVNINFPFCTWAPILYTSTVTRENLPKLFDLILVIAGNRAQRIETAALNRWFRDLVATSQPKGIGGLSVKAKYITQADICPPTFVLFLNDPKRLHFSSIRFFENKLREVFSLDGTPVRWVKKGREE